MSSGRPRVVELIGPAGAGKSTLSRMLHARDGRVRLPLSIWGLPRGKMVKRAHRLLPLVLHGWGSSWAGVLDIGMRRIRLSVLHQSLETEVRRGRQIIQFDEGPIFTLIWMRMHYAALIDAPTLQRWWRAELDRWRRSVDVLVVLDAPDADLAERIRSRSKPHRIKESTDAEIAGFVATFRTALEEVVAELTCPEGPVIMYVPTGSRSVEQVAGQILAALNEECHAG